MQIVNKMSKDKNFDHVALFFSDGRDFVAKCYTKILDRQASNSELDVYENALKKTSKLSIIVDMLLSNENKERLFNRNYSLFLNIFIFLSIKARLFNIPFSKRILNLLSVLYSNNLERKLHFVKIMKTDFLERISLLSSDITLQNGNIETLNDKYRAVFDIKRDIAVLRSGIQHDHVDDEYKSHVILNNAGKDIDVELSEYYKAFEDAHRGKLDDIRQKLFQYVPVLENFKIDNKKAIDIGCGRGEWLKLLKENGFQPTGVDMNPVMVEICQKQGLETVNLNALDYLKNQFDAKLGLITGFHIIEHMPFNCLFEIVKESKRVLQDGGMVIFETPNPENVMVGSNTFYDDFSHNNPLTPNAIKFLFEYHGFSEVTIKRLNPNHDIKKIEGTGELINRFNQYFYGPRDFAVIAIK